MTFFLQRNMNLFHNSSLDIQKKNALHMINDSINLQQNVTLQAYTDGDLVYSVPLGVCVGVCVVGCGGGCACMVDRYLCHTNELLVPCRHLCQIIGFLTYSRSQAVYIIYIHCAVHAYALATHN